MLIAICAAKSSTNKKHKDEKSKKLKVTDNKKHKDEPKKHKTKNEHKDSSKKHLKDAKKKQDLKKKDEKPKISEDKAINKTANNKTEIVEKKENSTKGKLKFWKSNSKLRGNAGSRTMTIMTGTGQLFKINSVHARCLGLGVLYYPDVLRKIAANSDSILLYYNRYYIQYPNKYPSWQARNFTVIELTPWS